MNRKKIQQRPSFHSKVKLTAAAMVGVAAMVSATHVRADAIPEVAITQFASAGVNVGSIKHPSAAAVEYVQFTDMSSSPVDMTGWSEDDSSETAGKAGHDLSAFGVIQPGQSVIFTEANPTDFETYWWGSPAATPAGLEIIGGYTNDNLSNSGDEINLYDNLGNLVDRLTYPGASGTGPNGNSGGPTGNGISAEPDAISVLGQNVDGAWSNAFVGDTHGSFQSKTGGLSGPQIGAPGTFMAQATIETPLQTIALGNPSGSGLVVPNWNSSEPDPSSVAGFFIGGQSIISQSKSSGNIAYYEVVSDPDEQHTANQGIFAGTVNAQQVVMQNGMQAPGFADGDVFDGQPSFQNAVYTDAAGEVAFAANVDNPDGSSAGSGIWQSRNGNLNLVATPGGQAAGLPAGVVYSSSFSHFQESDGGLIVFSSTISGTGIANGTQALFAGTGGSVNLVLRGGDVAPGTNGETFGNGLSNSAIYSNSANQLAIVDNIVNGTQTDGQGIWVGAPGSLNLLARTATQAPGLASSVLIAGFDSGSMKFNNQGAVAFTAPLTGTGVTAGVNDTALFAGGVGMLQAVARAGDQAPGTASGVTFGAFSNTPISLSDAGKILFSTGLTGNGVTGSNNTGLWYGSSGNLQLLFRTGDNLPDTTTSITSIGNFSNINAHGQFAVVVNNEIFGGTANDLQLVADLSGYFDANSDPSVLDATELTTNGNPWISDLQISDNGLVTMGLSLNNGDQGLFSLQLTDLSTVPEPGSLSLLGLGVPLLLRRRRRHSAAVSQ